MANHYLEFSFQVPLEKDQIMEVKAAWNIVCGGGTDWRLGATADNPEEIQLAQAFPHLKSDPGFDVSQTALALYQHIAAAVDDAEDIDDDSCPALSGIIVDVGELGMYVYADEYGNVEGAAAIVCALQDRKLLKKPLDFSYAYYCSKPRPNEFGGGAVWIADGKADYMGAQEWLGQKHTQHQERLRERANHGVATIIEHGAMHACIPLNAELMDQAHQALAIVDRQETDWLTAGQDFESLDFAKAFPHVDMSDPPPAPVQRLALNMLKALVETEPDGSALHDIAEGFATAPSAYVTTETGTTPSGENALHIRSVQQDDVNNIPQAVNACRALVETVEEHFESAQQLAAAAAKAVTAPAPDPGPAP